MKNIFTLLLMSFFIVAHAQFDLGMNYMYSSPKGTLGQNIQPVHSVVIAGTGRLNANPQFFLGGEISFGTYASKKQPQTYISPEDGLATTTDVDFSSNIYNYHVVAGYNLTHCAAVVPYVNMKVGASSFNTNIVIQDPEDHDSCSPLEEENVFRDAAFSAGAGAGLKIDASAIFKRADKGSWWFDFSADYLWGTSLDYINVKYLNPAEPGPNDFVRAVSAKFVHLHSQHIHEHQIAQVYTSNISLLNFKVGVVKTFGGCR